jgi:putative ABC transport system substrate-binding protein
VGYLESGHPSDPESPLFAHLFQSFAEGLRTFDYVEGQTVTIVWRFAEGRYDRLPRLAAELVSLGVDAIFTPSDHTTAAASRATQTIPIVFRPLKYDLVVNLTTANALGLALPASLLAQATIVH